LHDEFLKRKLKLKRLIEETAALKREAFLVIAKANRLTRHLTCRQRQAVGITYHFDEIKARIHQAGVLALRVEEAEPSGGLPSMRPDDFLSKKELKAMGFAVIGMIDSLRKSLVQLDLLEKRCRELILSINKALAAFRYEAKIINRKIYPFGVLSFCHRSLRNLLGNTFFTFRDMDGISNLCKITGLVLKIADAPLI
jgi:hypothetical protein